MASSATRQSPIVMGSDLEIATVACGDLAMTIKVFFNSLLIPMNS